MSKRLQVILDDREMRDIQRIARRHSMSVAEWVRQTLRAARLEEPYREARKKLESLRRSVEYSFPSGNIEEMLADIERGYLEDLPE